MIGEKKKNFKGSANAGGSSFGQKNYNKRKKRALSNKKRCKICFDKEMYASIDYKNASLLKTFLTDCGKILSSRVSGNCISCQRKLSNAIKVSRIMALIPFCSH